MAHNCRTVSKSIAEAPVRNCDWRNPVLESEVPVASRSMIRQGTGVNLVLLFHSMPRVRVLKKLMLVVALSCGAGLSGAAGAQEPGKIIVQSFTLENGLKVLIPPFIETGTRIVVNTEDVSYVERAK